MPLVFKARDWRNSVFVSATMASETIAAATGQVALVRRDPMAMKPFCGYHFGDYFAHWLSFDVPGARLPKIFHVNCFRKDADVNFLWPRFGENLRVLEWIIARAEGRMGAKDGLPGFMPLEHHFAEGLGVDPDRVALALQVDQGEWAIEQRAQDQFWAESRDRSARFDASAPSSEGEEATEL